MISQGELPTTRLKRTESSKIKREQESQAGINERK
jgi:hypothetical protein